MNYVYCLRMLNGVLAGLVVGLCFLKFEWNSLTRVRDMRVLGLGFLTAATAWGSLARRHDVFRPWLPLVTLGLLVCIYGMRRPAPGECRRKR